MSLAEVDFAVQRTDQTWVARTNANGDYIITVPQAGAYLVTAAKDGVGSDRRKVAVQRSGLVTANLTLWKTRTVTAAPQHCGTIASVDPPKVSPLAAGTEPGLTRLLAWLQAVQRHTPGCADSSAFEVARWSEREFAILLRDIRALVTFLHRTEDGGGGIQRDQLILFLYDRRLTLDDLQRFFGNEPLKSNDLLRRGALLHADSGIFVQGNMGRYPVVEDGGQRGWLGESSQWDAGRQLLDAIAPAPATDAGALLWYRAVSAHLFRHGNLAAVATHLSRGRQVFPHSAELLFDSGSFHQLLSSPEVQASVKDLRANGVGVAVGSRTVELQRADRFFRQALAFASDEASARLRLGHTLGELGRHKEAAAELRQALDAKDGPQAYLAALFLGREHEALGMSDEARRDYQHASDLYPGAQSPRLALSRLARHTGDRATAQDALRRLAAPSSLEPFDPWWDFYRPHNDDAEMLMEELRRMVVSGGIR